MKSLILENNVENLITDEVYRLYIFHKGNLVLSEYVKANTIIKIDNLKFRYYNIVVEFCNDKISPTRKEYCIDLLSCNRVVLNFYYSNPNFIKVNVMDRNYPNLKVKEEVLYLWQDHIV